MRYRADQIGSFLRPPEVHEARKAYLDGRITLDDLRKVEDDAVLRVLDIQKRSGIGVLSDGEQRRGGWSAGFGEAVDGFVDGEPPVTRPALGGVRASGATVAGPGGRIIGAKFVQRRRLTEHESGFLRQHVGGAPYKVTMPAASYVVARGYRPGVTDKVYADRKAVLEAAVAIIREEIEALLAEGAPYIQLDNPHYPDYVDEERCEQWRRIGVDPDKALLEDVEADNASLRGFHGPNVTLAMHFCRGNSAGGGWHTSGGYDRIAEPVFSGLDVDTFLLEYDSERAGTFEPLRHMPKGKTVTLGLVTTKVATLESQDLLLRQDRRGVQVRGDGRPGAQPAMRLRLDPPGQSSHRGRRTQEARTGGRYRNEGLGLRPAAVAGHVVSDNQPIRGWAPVKARCTTPCPGGIGTIRTRTTCAWVSARASPTPLPC